MALLKKFSQKRVVLVFLIILTAISGFFALNWAEKKEESERKSPKSVREGIIITTDKTEYKQGEIIEIKIKNGLDTSIYYPDPIKSEFSFWGLEKFEDNKWKKVYFFLPKKRNKKVICQSEFYREFIFRLSELKPGSDLIYQWNQKVCLEFGVPEPEYIIMKGLRIGPYEPKLLKKGVYRVTFRYSLDPYFLSSEERFLSKTEIIKSKEFIIK